MKILIVEDDENKRKAIANYIMQTFPKVEIKEANSYLSGVDMAMQYDFDLLLLDMSIPNFDGKDNKNSGEKLKNGGELIIQELLDEKIQFHCTIITQYETFNNESLESIDRRLKRICGNQYHGCIRYNTNNDQWKELLKNNIENVINSYCR